MGNDYAFYTEAMSEGVIPTTRRRVDTTLVAGTEAATALVGFDVSSVDLDASSGGFDAVVQISAARCLLGLPSPLPIVLEPSDEDVEAVNAAAIPDEARGRIVLRIDVRAVGLRFEGAAGVVLQVAGDSVLCYETRTAAVDRDGVPGYALVVFARIGQVRAELFGTWRAEVSAELTRATIVADFGSGTARAITTDPGLSGLYHRLLEPTLASRLATALLRRADHTVALAPTVAIMGKAPAHLAATGRVARCEAGVVARGTLQAIAIGFQFDPHGAGTLAMVRHAIGGFHYGVLHSERTISDVVANLWSDGTGRRVSRFTRIERATGSITRTTTPR
jgi:hypothetical protein